jgi:hypothetical protein
MANWDQQKLDLEKILRKKYVKLYVILADRSTMRVSWFWPAAGRTGNPPGASLCRFESGLRRHFPFMSTTESSLTAPKGKLPWQP